MHAVGLSNSVLLVGKGLTLVKGNNMSKTYELAGGISNEFKALAKQLDSKVIGEGEQSWVADSTISLSNIELDVERQRVNAVLEVMPNEFYRVSIGEWGVELWDYEWDVKLFDIDFDGIVYSVINISAFISRIIWGLAVNLRERVTA